jgi:resuscitation-promoting factor RpfA
LSDVSDPELEELIREIDRLASRQDWDSLLALRDRARAAHERGKQHWPAAAHAEYRLALEAPGEYAGAVIVEGAGRFALGPLSEVAASTHTWAELATHIAEGPLRSITAHERIVRGEDLSDDPRVDRLVLPVPLALERWEPSYAIATYEHDKADFPVPPLPSPSAVELPPAPYESTTDADEALALRALVATWLTDSNGRSESVGVEGSALTAIAALGVTQARVAHVTLADAMALVAWVGASGGAAGRRRGMAWGRFLAWESAAELAGVDIEDDVGGAADELRWFVWDTGTADTGWSLRLAVEDPEGGCAWALAATDRAV